MRIPYFLAATIFAATFSSATAQSVTTAPVGAMTTTLGVGITPLGISLVNPDLISTSVTSASSSTLTLDTTAVGNILSADEPYYLEVYSGDLKGDRFDVDVTATIANNDNTVVLQVSSPENTFDASSIGSLLDGKSVRIRKHVTIEQLHQSVVGNLVGGNNASLADQIKIFDSVAGVFASYYLRSDGITWRRVGSLTNAGKQAIYPGKGVFFIKNTSNVDLTLVGAVRTNDFVQKFNVGYQLASLPWPVDFSPSGYHAVAANGWSGDNNASLADQIKVYNAAVGVYYSYYLREDGVTWRKVGSLSSVTNVDVIPGFSSFFVYRENGDSGFLYVNDLNL